MNLTSLTYTSLASLDLEADDLEDIHRTAQQCNALEGITGLLVFNGTHFLQVVEGADNAIDELVERLRRDPRHNGLEIRDRHTIEARNFPDWSMELVRVSASYFPARDTIENRLPNALPEGIRARLMRMTELISTMHFDT